MLPTFGGRIVVDDRVSGRVELATGRVRAGAESFVARERVIRVDDEVTFVAAGGGTDAAFAVLPQVDLVGRVEMARALAADDTLTKVWDTRATLGLSAHYDKIW